MWIKTYSKQYSGIKKEDIWRLWTDIDNWPAWHEGLEYCKIEGPFKIGNHFMLKPKGVSPVKIVLMEIDQGNSFTDCTLFFGAKMYDTHSMEETPDGLILYNKIVVTGPLKWLWIKLVAQGVAETIPDKMDALVTLARKKHA